MKAVVLLSGGIDSTTLIHYVKKILKKDVYAISFIYGQRHSKEIEYAKYQAKVVNVIEHKIIDISFLKELIKNSALINKQLSIPRWEEAQKEMPITYVPFRNLIFLSISLAYAESNNIDEIYYAAQRQDYIGYWDCREDFVNIMNNLTSLNPGIKIKILAPFVNLRKSEIIKIGFDLNVDYTKTWSCYKGEDEPCGICPSCVDRKRAFEELGIYDIK
ncbi:MAG: 7-cyano-7-deazaguanine synthase QueC [candidate division WOR-3 bacterium]|jgi:7-cyano-7-deazaguanine synthase